MTPICAFARVSLIRSYLFAAICVLSAARIPQQDPTMGWPMAYARDRIQQPSRTTLLWNIGKRISFLHHGRSSGSTGNFPWRNHRAHTIRTIAGVLHKGNIIEALSKIQTDSANERFLVPIGGFRASVQRRRIASAVESLSEGMGGIGAQVGHLDHDPIWTADVSHLSADPSPGGVKGRTTDSAKPIDPLLVVASGEDRRQIRASLDRFDGGSGFDRIVIHHKANPEADYYANSGRK